MNHVLLVIVSLNFIIGYGQGQVEDGPVLHSSSRCVCKCPTLDILKKDNLYEVSHEEENSDPDRTIYVNATVSPEQCDCLNVVLANVNLSSSQRDAFCPRCKCNFQLRNLTIVKVRRRPQWVNSIVPRVK